MALDDFDPADPERDKDFLEENAEDGEDLFDFPVVEMSTESTDSSNETEDIVLAAADLAGQLADELDIDFDFDDSLEDDLEALGLSEPAEEAEAPAEAVSEDMVFDFDDLVAGIDISESADAGSEEENTGQAPEELVSEDMVFDFDDLVSGIDIGGDGSEAADADAEPALQESEQAAAEDPVAAVADDESMLLDDLDIDLDLDLDADIEEAFAEMDAESELEPAPPKATVEAPPEEELVAMDELTSDILDEAGEEAPVAAGFLSKAKLPALGSNKAMVALIGVILFFNGLTALLGFYAISVFSDGMEGMSTNLADSLHQMRTAKPEVSQVPQVAQEESVEDTTGTVFAGPIGTPTEAPEDTELKAARKQLDEGQFHEARRRLFRLLAIADSPLLGDGKYAEAEASLMIAESYRLEAEALMEKAQ